MGVSDAAIEVGALQITRFNRNNTPSQRRDLEKAAFIFLVSFLERDFTRAAVGG
jgi:hypothetical protein